MKLILLNKKNLHQVEQVHVHQQYHQKLKDHVDYDELIEMLLPFFYQEIFDDMAFLFVFSII